MHYLPQLVHSLWVSLWKQKNFATQYRPDLHKRISARVEKKYFCETFIHSLQPAAVDCGLHIPSGRGASHISGDQKP